MAKNRLIISITIVACLVVILSSAHFARLYFQSPVSRLEKDLSNLRSRGLPIESVYFDDEIGYVVVEFSDMEPEYVEPIQEILGYDVPVLFRELEPRKVLSGEPPSQPFELCNALNMLVENLDYSFVYHIDVQEGLLILEFKDLKDEEMQEIIRVAGDEVAIQFVERPWGDRLYIGEPSSDIESLEAAEERLDSSIQSGIRDIVAMSYVRESAGLLEVLLYDLDDYDESIEAIRSMVGLDTPLAFVLTRRKPPEILNLNTADSLLNYYTTLLNLSDVGYEIIWQSESKPSKWQNLNGEATIYFSKDGDKVPFQKLRLNKTDGSWTWVGGSKWGVASPSRDVEILGYIVDVCRIDGRKSVSCVTPMVKNSGDGTAYIWSVQVEIMNATYAYNHTYHTVGMDLWSGLIDSGEVKFVWIRGELDLPLDPLRRRTYTISIILRDGEENILTERSFTHTFSSLQTGGP